MGTGLTILLAVLAVDPVMHAYATGPDLDALIARLHGDPAFELNDGCCFTNCWLPVRRAKSTNYADRRSVDRGGPRSGSFGSRRVRRAAPSPRSSRRFETPAEGTR